ncbi:hypothetical protein GCM10011613_32970 [Cellvibrio zantedeschiae]|uniref:NAD-dependent dehydratase n=1 Tax=Cellvibrio zantedeschiae TaxID=1237077 RepID=A0ABQ3BAP2_9GAMM|nr:DoxX-like family protein [Cellvibrio zantedeschiae]GGY85257.1 hypothetical protein GCM10011613_32970 [Cellvibrio zantedeschiae]
MLTQSTIFRYCRFSLAFMWLFTAATSFWWGRDIGYEVLALQNIQNDFADLCINAGSLLDAFIGLWLLGNYQLKWCYRLQITIILVYSLLLSFIAPQFWLHPFGPITKNIPILALLFFLYKFDSSLTTH